MGRFRPNRVLVGLVFFLLLIALYQFQLKPQYRPLYEMGIKYYQATRYPEALRELQKAYEIAPNSVDVIVMLGWANLKVNHLEEARFFFNRALRIDSRLEEARIGSSFVALHTGKGEIDIAIMREFLGRRGADADVQMLIAGALSRQGKHFEALPIYQRLLTNPSYTKAARLALDETLGLQGFPDDPVPAAFDTRPVRRELGVSVKAVGQQFSRLVNGAWRPWYVNGVNLGTAAPGHYPSTPPIDGAMYAAWLKQVSELNANALRVFTLLPPSFYRAYHKLLASGSDLMLFQQVWIGDPPGRDLYDPAFVEQSRAEIRYVIDALHGHAEVPPKNARGSGIYVHDVSEHVAGILLGREMEPSVVTQTNVVNGGKSRYQGKFVTIQDATATEVWFAEMMDYLLDYEVRTYNTQHPVAIVNWPPLDPLTHPTEAPLREEIRFRIQQGEKLSLPTGPIDDNDVVSIDEAKFQMTGQVQAGFFAAYQVYPYYPEFLVQEPEYLNARDAEGLNPMAGYLKQLRARIPYPLIVSEYGVPNSIGVSHFHPYGWHHGGHGEAEQAAILVRLSRTVREVGAAGGMLFSLFDEWYKHDWLDADFENPAERSALWTNPLDPEKWYGLIGWRTQKAKLFTEGDEAWRAEQTLYENRGAVAPGADPYEGARTVRSLQAAADEAFLYLRLKVGCLDCAPKDPRARFDRAAYAIALNTLPGQSGFRQLPFGGVQTGAGANFVLVLNDPSVARLLIANNYNPYYIIPTPGVPNQTDLTYRPAFTPTLDNQGPFAEMVVETTRRRFARDGKMFPPQRYSRGTLRHGDGVADTLAEWRADLAADAIVVRIPWGKLLVTDPSDRRAFFGFEAGHSVKTTPMPGIDVSLFVFKPETESTDLQTMSLVATYPKVVSGAVASPARLTWDGWNTVKPEPYLKKSYHDMQKFFTDPGSQQAPIVAATRDAGADRGSVVPAGGPAGAAAVRR